VSLSEIIYDGRLRFRLNLKLMLRLRQTIFSFSDLRLCHNSLRFRV
jgi:hypothetical protein